MTRLLNSITEWFINETHWRLFPHSCCPWHNFRSHCLKKGRFTKSKLMLANTEFISYIFIKWKFLGVQLTANQSWWEDETKSYLDHDTLKALCKTVVSLLLRYWRYYSLIQGHWYDAEWLLVWPSFNEYICMIEYHHLNSLTLLVLKAAYSERTSSKPWLLMPWLSKPPFIVRYAGLYKKQNIQYIQEHMHMDLVCLVLLWFY